ncbi:hypothetical protein [Billgrantia antri]|uniref:Uncharacterized protein n=1 Tax=Billgrantia antri TaxID=2846777 RepID=A0ABS6ZTV0_9GAMM|nr:hypothetical protein [Halomonas antri]MBW6393263.1 hypothetical protein [Halomonas antri]
MNDVRQWVFVADMNYSDSVTISDVWLWVKWLYFYPGDAIIYYIVNFFTGIANFFEISNGDYGGVLSGVISFFAWVIVLESFGRVFK